MTKQDLIKILLADFEKSFSAVSRVEKLELFSRLNLLEVSDLKLLVSQCEA